MRPNAQNSRTGCELELMEQLLATMEVGVGAFTSCDVRRGYDLTFDAASSATVHYCLDGMGELMIIKGRSLQIAEAHVRAFVPPGVVYSIGSVGRCAEGQFPTPPVSSAPVLRERANAKSRARQEGNCNGVR